MRLKVGAKVEAYVEGILGVGDGVCVVVVGVSLMSASVRHSRGPTRRLEPRIEVEG